MLKPEHIRYLLNIALLVRVRHWQTTSYAEHVALGGLYDDLDEFIDRWVEAQQGSGETRLTLGEEGADVHLMDMTAEDIVGGLTDLDGFLRKMLNQGVKPEFQNLIDELAAKLDKVQYLLTLK